jgi:hypothetical protein
MELMILNSGFNPAVYRRFSICSRSGRELLGNSTDRLLPLRAKGGIELRNTLRSARTRLPTRDWLLVGVHGAADHLRHQLFDAPSALLSCANYVPPEYQKGNSKNDKKNPQHKSPLLSTGAKRFSVKLNPVGTCWVRSGLQLLLDCEDVSILSAN